jgi:uncharacterized HAD superfamily protein/orotate phosphoribosyltransferase
MFGYVSFAQLTAAIRAQLHLLASDIDLVVGIPRSGMIPAYQIALFLNRLVADLDAFLSDAKPGHGSTRELGVALASTLRARHILLVDDSIATGQSMQRALERIRSAGFAGRISTCAAIVTPSQRSAVDVAFLTLPLPRLFEWNAFHHRCVENACFDLDGVLCVDPTEHDNDDGERYRHFLRTARPLFAPSLRIGHIVSARLEKYRTLTEEWLAAHDIRYGALHLLDLPSKEERMRQAAHCTHKIRVYRETGASLFYESDPAQAREIARGAGKPVLCVGEMSMMLPDGMHLGAALRTAAWHARHPLGRAKGWLQRRLKPRGPAIGPRTAR